ncbi:MAG: amidohydrolase family protein [Algoriphagus sp.]|nr:amidohydrolase family protein [Algoriphagus sp.]
MTSKFLTCLCCFLVCFQLKQSTLAQSNIQYDIVLAGGRVIDPETKLDAIRNVGIIQNRIAQISSDPLQGKEIIDVSGMVVAPGFIDLHVHGRSNVEQEYQLHDGVTTALDLEWGVENLGMWYESRKSKALIHYGASVNWPFERFKSMEKYQKAVQEANEQAVTWESTLSKIDSLFPLSFTQQLSPKEEERTHQNIKSSLEDGGLGIGVPIGYLPQTKPGEMYRVFELAAELDALVYTHVRVPNYISVQEVIADATITGAPLHIVHINSVSLDQIDLAVEMVQTAQAKGFDISTELYPYTAASTGIQSAIFDEGWQERLNISYWDLQWVATGERLTKETFEAYQKTGGSLIIHLMKPEWIKIGIAAPGVMIASDGSPYSKLAHPRTAGTFSKVLGQYVREEKVIDLPTAIAKMTLLPAKRLENLSPMMRFKGRIQVGADADITIFNPATVIDKATFEEGLAFSEGIEYVMVNGTFVLRNGETVLNVFPGNPVYGKFKK